MFDLAKKDQVFSKPSSTKASKKDDTGPVSVPALSSPTLVKHSINVRCFKAFSLLEASACEDKMQQSQSCSYENVDLCGHCLGIIEGVVLSAPLTKMWHVDLGALYINHFNIFGVDILILQSHFHCVV